MRVEDICKELGISNYTINRDGTIDVDGDVDLSWKRLKKIPLKFGRVSGDFNCYNNYLTALEGAPKEVGGHFWCNSNHLTTLKGAPIEVGGDFWCSDNKLTSLEGAPMEVGRSFWCQYNHLTTLEGGPMVVGGYFYCVDNPIYDEYKKWGSYESYIRDGKLNGLI